MRKSVKDFADAMERMLTENDYKNGWESMDAYELLGRISEERDELFRAVDRYFDVDGETDELRADMLGEAIDIANFCMMLFDNYNEGGEEK